MRNISNRQSLKWMLVLAVIVTLTSLTVFSNDRSYSLDNSIPCGNGTISSSTDTAGTSTVILPALAEINISVPVTVNATAINIYAKDSGSNTEKLIGRAQPISSVVSDSSNWKFVWPTALWTRPATGAGTVALSAKVSNSASTTCTLNSSVSYYIPYNNTAAALNVNVTPQSYTTYTGASNTQEIKAIPTSLTTTLSADNINRYGVFTWSTDNNNIGGISNSIGNFLSNSSVIFNAGTNAGTNNIKVYYSYGGAVSNTVAIPINVKAPETATTTPSDDTTNSQNTTQKTGIEASTIEKANTISTTTPITTSELTTTTQITSSQLQLSDSTKSCIKTGIDSNARYEAIVSGTGRPTVEELSKIGNCFATSKYILPTNFSPVDPVSVDKLSADNAVEIAKLENVSKTSTAGTKDTLKITGKAAPKSKVFIYVFSDPLVITTTADADGNWQYTLEDPLVPGKHEVYAVVNKGDGAYKRSDPFSFLISTASATDTNPSGLSLKLSGTPIKTPDQSQGSLILYIAGSVTVVIIALTILLLVLRSHNKHKLALSQVTTANPDCTYCNPSLEAETYSKDPQIQSISPAVDKVPEATLDIQTDQKTATDTELLEKPQPLELLEQPEQPDLLETPHTEKSIEIQENNEIESQPNSDEQIDTTNSKYESK